MKITGQGTHEMFDKDNTVDAEDSLRQWGGWYRLQRCEQIVHSRSTIDFVHNP